MENFDDDIARMLALSALEPESGELPKIRLNKTIPADKKVIKQMMSVLTPQQFISLYQSNPNTKAMKFTVTRTSDRHNANKPCNNAVCVKPYEPERFNGHNYADSEGQWEIEINTLEDLLALIGETNHPIILDCDSNNKEYDIEIYDDWRE